MADWFSYLGPSGFISTVVDDFREGRSVVLQIPRNTHLGLLQAIQHEATKENRFEWTTVDTSNDTPLASIWNTFAPDHSAVTTENKIKALYALPQFQNHIVVPASVAEDQIAPWLEFMELFAHVSRGIDPFRRTEILLIVESGNKPIVQKSDPLLYNRIADNLVHKWDTLYRAHAHLHAVTKSVREKQLHAEVAAALALWDDQLCSGLCSIRLDQLMNPTAYLTCCACDRGWQNLSESDHDRLWMEGIYQTYGEKAQCHSAFLALLGRKDELESRIWKAQVTVLLPLIEQCRQHAIATFRYLLQVPHEDGHGGVISQVDDLEISHILYQLNTNRRYDFSKEKVFFAAIRNARNALAHGETVTPADLKVIMTTSLDGGTR